MEVTVDVYYRERRRPHNSVLPPPKFHFGIQRSALLVVVLVCVVPCLRNSHTTYAQNGDVDWQSSAGGKMTFDAASVKQDVAGLPPVGPAPTTNMSLSSDDFYKPTGGLFRVTNVPLTTIITFAYKLNLGQTLLLGAQVSSTHDLNWVFANRWDIEARAQRNPTKDQYRLMLQSLLADRFKLRFHMENEQAPIYALELIKPGQTGPELRPHPADSPCVDQPNGKADARATPPCGVVVFSSPVPGRHRLSGRAVRIQQICDRLGSNAPEKRPVLDRTALSGTFDFTFDWAPEYQGPLPPPDIPSLTRVLPRFLRL